MNPTTSSNQLIHKPRWSIFALGAALVSVVVLVLVRRRVVPISGKDEQHVLASVADISEQGDAALRPYGDAVVVTPARPGMLRMGAAYVLAITAMTLMAGSAYAFDPAASIPLMGEAALLFLIGGGLLGLAIRLAAHTPHVPALPVPVGDKQAYAFRLHGPYLVIGIVLLGLLGLIRLIQAPLPLEVSPGQDVLLFSVLTWMKNYSLLARVSGGVQFMLLLSGGLSFALGAGAVRLGFGRQITFLLGLFTLTILSEVNGKVFDLKALAPVSTNVQFWLLVLGIALVVIGLGGWPRRIKVGRYTFWMLAGLTLLALGLRLWQLNSSVRFFVDELLFTSAVQLTWVNPNLELLVPLDTISAVPNLFPYLQSQGVVLFGRNFMGMRASTALLGALSIPALYGLARALFDKRTALVAALLLATFPPHLHFSRLAIPEMTGSVLGTLALALLAQALIYNQRGNYVLGGAMLGLTHYFHEGSRMFFTPLAILWVVAIIVIWRPRVQLGHVLLAVVTALIVALPIYYTLAGIDRPVAARMVDNNSALGSAYWRNLFDRGNLFMHVQQHIIPPLLVYVSQVEHTLFYRGKTALVLVAAVPALFVGLFYALWRWRVPGLLLLFLWWLATTAGNMILVISDSSARYVIVFPALALLVAVGLRYGLALIWPDGEQGIRMPVVILAVLTVGLAVIQTNYYFNQHLPVYNEQFRSNWPHRDGQDAVLRMLSLPAGTQMQIVSEVQPDHFFTNGVLMFMSSDYPELESLSPADVTPAYLAGLKRNIGQAFFVEPRNNRLIETLQAHFPNLPAPQESPYDLAPEKQFLLYFIPPQGSAR